MNAAAGYLERMEEGVCERYGVQVRKRVLFLGGKREKEGKVVRWKRRRRARGRAWHEVQSLRIHGYVRGGGLGQFARFQVPSLPGRPPSNLSTPTVIATES